jgi:murein DD-endopeptidase MepM/ murein hydrolase activator NlpD
VKPLALAPALALALSISGSASANPYRWPLADGDRYVTAHYDHGNVTDWACGNNTYSGHRGTDIGVVKFTPVYAAASGWVKHRTDGYGDGYIGNTDGGGFGNCVAIYHADGNETIYGHLAAGTGLPALGATVTCADGIGGSGTSGNSSGPHLHFETRVGVDENGSYYSGSADDPYAGECGGPISFWTDQAGDTPTLQCGGGSVPLTDDAAYVADVTIPDGTEVVAASPGRPSSRPGGSATAAPAPGATASRSSTPRAPTSAAPRCRSRSSPAPRPT